MNTVIRVEMRLDRVAQQLLKTDRSVEQIAYDMGVGVYC